MASTTTLDRSVAPTAREMGHLTIPPLNTIVTPSGARIHTVSGGEADVTRITATLRGGLSEVPSPEIPPLIAPLWIEGTASHAAAEIADFFDYRGAWIKAECGIHRLSMTVSALNSNVDEIIPLMGEIMASPAFGSDELARLSRRTAGRLQVDRAKVSWHAADNLRRLTYGATHPIALTPSPDKLTDVTSVDLRRWYDSVLTPANMEFFISGKVKESTIHAISRIIESSPRPGRQISIDDIPFNPSATCSRIHKEMPESQQSAVRIGLLLPGRRHPDFISLRLLVTALGGYFGSRLMLNIREDKGYTYGINAITLGYVTDSLMSISSETDASTVEPLIAETIAEIERMKDPSSYTAEEMERLRSFALSNLAAMLDTPLTVMDHYQSSITAGAPDGYFDMQQQAIRAMTPESLASLARRYFDTSRLYISTAGK